MTDPRKISIKDYTYFLPEERIASYPLAERDASRLLIYKDDEISEDIFRNISRHIPENSLLLFNNTKVVEARLLFQKPTGGVIEIFCLSPHESFSPGSGEDPVFRAFLQQGKVLWQCLVGGVSKWKAGQQLEMKIKNTGQPIILKARYIEKITDSFIIELSWSPAVLSFAEVLHLAGAVPLPPYIKRAAEASDSKRYQTVYAQFDGSVAAPTAGLHFTGNLFKQLKEKNIQTDFVTLHVGAGTFKPVKAETLQDHDMHAEWMDVSKDTIKRILVNLENKIIAVGTTSLRTIESLYWLGRKPEFRSGHHHPEQRSGYHVSQWEAYEHPEKNIPAKDALESLLDWMDKNKLERFITKTQLLVAPGYPFKIVSGLITNFHQPQSTLLLLVAALVDRGRYRDSWKKIYAYALKNEFRFLSYGDGCLLWRQPG